VWAYNNQTFSDEDWEGICKLGSSIKQKDPSSTGRFGLGFNSVYHTTDVPSILSGEYVAWIDPHHLYLPGREGGRKVRVAVAGAKGVSHPGLLAPYVEASTWFGLGRGIDGSNGFAGTLFRLPLRLPEQADVSKLSDEVTSLAEAGESLTTFMQGLQLLFLENVTKVSVYELKAGQTKPIELHCVNLSRVEEVTARRSTFAALLKHSLAGAATKTSLTTCDEVVEVRRETQGTVANERWLLCRSLAAGGRFADQLKEKNWQEFASRPLCGVAIRLGDSPETLQGSTCESSHH
jgi:sacsin